MSVSDKDIIFSIYHAADKQDFTGFRYLVGKYGTTYLINNIRMKDIKLGSGLKSLLYALLKSNKLSHQDYFDLIEENYIIDSNYKSIYTDLQSEYISASGEDKKFWDQFIKKYLYNIYKDILFTFPPRRETKAVVLYNSISLIKSSYKDIKLHPDIVYNIMKYLKVTDYLSNIDNEDLENISFYLLLIIYFFYIIKKKTSEINELDGKINNFISYFDKIPNKEDKLSKFCLNNSFYLPKFSKDFVELIKSKTTIELDKIFDYEPDYEYDHDEYYSDYKISILFKKFSELLAKNNMKSLSEDVINDKFTSKYIDYDFFLYLIRENIFPKSFNPDKKINFIHKLNYSSEFNKFYDMFCLSKKFQNNLLNSFYNESIGKFVNFFYYFIVNNYIELNNENKFFTNIFFKNFVKMIDNLFYLIKNNSMRESVIDPLIHMSFNDPYILNIDVLEPFCNSTFIYILLDKCNIPFIKKYFDNNNVQNGLIYNISTNPHYKLYFKNLLKKLKEKVPIFPHLNGILDLNPKEYVVAGHGVISKNSYFIVPDNVTIVYLTENTKILYLNNYNRVSGLPFDNSDIISKKEILKLILNYGIGRIYPSGYLVPNTKINFDLSWEPKYTPEHYSTFSGLIEDTDFDKKITDVTNSGLGLIETLHKLDELNDISGCIVRFSKSKLNIDQITKEKNLDGFHLLSDIITPKNINDYLKDKDPKTPVIFYISSCRFGKLKTFERCYPSWQESSILPSNLPLPLLRSPSNSVFTEIKLYGISNISNFRNLLTTQNLSKIWNGDIKKNIQNLLLSNEDKIYTVNYKTICYFYGIVKDEACKEYENSFKNKYLKYRNKYLALKKKLNDKI
jgi:hypothetical protein